MIVEAATIKLAGRNSSRIGETFHESERRRFAELCSKTIEIAHDIQILFGECISVIIENSIPEATISSSTRLEGVTHIDDLRLPFFTAD
jgi:hypothetical protein